MFCAIKVNDKMQLCIFAIPKNQIKDEESFTNNDDGFRNGFWSVCAKP